jgi:glyoxylase I family protein
VALVPRDLEASLRFYRDGLGLRELADFAGLVGQWRHLFGAPADELRSIFLGSPDHGNAGVVELVVFSAAVPAEAIARPVGAEGFFLLSFYVTDVGGTMARLGELGVGDDPKCATIGEGDGILTIGTVRDPDGMLIELVGLPPEQGFGS